MRCTLSFRPRCKIDNIERVENKSQYNAFDLYKQTVNTELRHTFHEKQMVRMLFHGTSPESSHDIIHGEGYVPLAAGSASGAVWGDGTYFARDAKYSHTYTKVKPSGQRNMLLSAVVVGMSTKGDKGIKPYPKVPDSRNTSMRYHSLVNNENDPSIFYSTIDQFMHSIPDKVIKLSRRWKSNAFIYR